MAKVDKLKEEIGWLKSIFTISVVTDISLLAWLVQNYDRTNLTLLLGCISLILVVTIIIVLLNRMSYRKIDELEEL